MADAASIVYVSNADSADLSVLALDRHGALTTLQTLPCGGAVMPLAVSPDQRFLYAALRSEPYAVLAYGIGADGRLSEHARAPLPDSMAYIATDATGRWLLGASYGGAIVSVSAIDTQGRPAAAHQVIGTPPKAHSIRASRDNRFVFAAVLGADRLLTFAFDAAAGRLDPMPDADLTLDPHGCGPRHFVEHPQLPVTYVLCELDGALHVIAHPDRVGRAGRTMASRQRVSVLPPGFAGEPWSAELRVSGDGRHVYATERRSSIVAGFAIDPHDATLAPIGPISHWPTQAQPRGMAIDPSGAFVIVAGQQSHRVGVHRRDARSGALQLVGEHAVGRNPNWVEVIEL